MKQRLIVVGIGLPVLVTAAMFLPPWALTVLTVIITTVGSAELIRSLGAGSVKRVYGYSALAAAAVPVAVCLGIAEKAVPVILYLLVLILGVETVFTRGKERSVSVRDVLVCIAGGVGIPWLMSHILRLKMLDYGGTCVMLGFCITMLSDTGGYFGGKLFGKHRPLPNVSPNKTTEGFVGSLLLCIVSVFCFGLVTQFALGFKTNFLALALYIIPCNFSTQLGDLAFSAIKREVGIKDFGKVLPGHGGMLDRFDSQIFTMPMLYLLMSLVPAFG